MVPRDRDLVTTTSGRIRTSFLTEGNTYLRTTSAYTTKLLIVPDASQIWQLSSGHYHTEPNVYLQVYNCSTGVVSNADPARIDERWEARIPTHDRQEYRRSKPGGGWGGRGGDTHLLLAFR